MMALSPRLQLFIRLATLAAIGLGLLLSGQGSTGAATALGVVLIVFGIPHGAADYLIFQDVTRRAPSRREAWKFAGFYFVLLLGYGLLWYALPLAAFGLFLVISLYHFGQSHFHDAVPDERFPAGAAFFTWGALTTLFPVLLHYDESVVIIQEITGTYLPLSPAFRSVALLVIAASNLVLLGVLYRCGYLSGKRLLNELANLGLLIALYFSASLLLGFAAFFLLWHSIPAALDQLRFFRRRRGGFTLSTYTRRIVPLSVAAFGGLALFYLLSAHRFDYGMNLGALFIFIALITIPHALLVDRLYHMENGD